MAAVYVRKIAPAKWGSDKGLNPGEVPSDAVTGDLRTKENALSLWKCRSDREDCIEQAALAIAAAGDYIDRVHLVLIPEQHLMDNASLRATRGRTPYRSFSRQHCDLTDLDGARLVQVAGLIAGAIKSNMMRTVPKSRIIDMIGKDIERGIIAKSDLSRKLQERLFPD